MVVLSVKTLQPAALEKIPASETWAESCGKTEQQSSGPVLAEKRDVPAQNYRSREGRNHRKWRWKWRGEPGHTTGEPWTEPLGATNRFQEEVAQWGQHLYDHRRGSLTYYQDKRDRERMLLRPMSINGLWVRYEELTKHLLLGLQSWLGEKCQWLRKRTSGKSRGRYLSPHRAFRPSFVLTGEARSCPDRREHVQ